MLLLFIMPTAYAKDELYDALEVSEVISSAPDTSDIEFEENVAEVNGRLDSLNIVLDGTVMKTVGDITVANVKMIDSKGRFVPTACKQMEFTAPEGLRILGWGNGDPAFQHVERPLDDSGSMKIVTFNGLAQVILQQER